MSKVFTIISITIFANFSVFANNYADTNQIKKHFISISKTHEYRNYHNINLLDSTAGYIFSQFNLYADTVYFQEYKVNGSIYKNVICSFGSKNLKSIIIGAHYDVCGNQEGADDNASGIIGLLELARLLKNQKPNYRIELVAYSLEEPPFFKTENMGSYIHAKSLLDNKIDVYGMICLEMIGYYKNEKESQTYPIGLLKIFYGNIADYITLVRKYCAGRFANKFSRNFKHSKTINTKKFSGPKFLPGVDFSDHLNYWKFGFSALMITDTSFYRNENYHQKSDKMETLDLGKMAKVIDGVFIALLGM